MKLYVHREAMTLYHNKKINYYACYQLEFLVHIEWPRQWQANSLEFQVMSLSGVTRGLHVGSLPNLCTCAPILYNVMCNSVYP